MAVTVSGTQTGYQDTSNELTLPAPTGVGFYVLNGPALAPEVAPDFTGHVYALRYPSTPWATRGFAFAIDATSTAIPTLYWRWLATVEIAWVMFDLTACAFTLRASDVGTSPNYSPAGDSSAEFSLRGFTVTGGDGVAAGPPTYTPIATLGVGGVPVEGFDSYNGTPSATIIKTDPADHDDGLSWATNGSFGPYFGWGSTLSVTETSPAAVHATGWHVGRLIG